MAIQLGYRPRVHVASLKTASQYCQVLSLSHKVNVIFLKGHLLLDDTENYKTMNVIGISTLSHYVKIKAAYKRFSEYLYKDDDKGSDIKSKITDLDHQDKSLVKLWERLKGIDLSITYSLCLFPCLQNEDNTYLAAFLFYKPTVFGIKLGH